MNVFQNKMFGDKKVSEIDREMQILVLHKNSYYLKSMCIILFLDNPDFSIHCVEKEYKVIKCIKDMNAL